MEYLDKAILKKYEHHWITLRDAGFIKNLNKEDVEEIESVYKRLIDRNFFVNKWCMSCVAEMMRILYVYTKFDSIKNEEVNNVKELKELILEINKTTIFDSTLMDELKEEPAAQPKKRGRKKKNQ